MLWEKESSQPDALYIDIIPPNMQHWDTTLDTFLQTINQLPHPEKSDTVALEKFIEGNELFRECAPLEAMQMYSDSLRFAVPGSKHISLAYSNRSACFLNLNLYDECLADIESAMAAGYPENLRPKLAERKAQCLKEMHDDPHYPRKKLSINPNERIPYLSNAAMLQRNVESTDYSVVARMDIDVGQPIAIEDAYHINVSHGFGLYCNICAKQFCNLVPCDKCAAAMFCPECHGHFLHQYECGLSICGESNFNSDVMHLARGILLVLKMFATADELMSFVQRMLERPNKLPKRLLDETAKYRAFFKCPFKENFKSLDQLGQELYPVYKTLLRIPHVNEMFKTTKHRRFFMHLIGHHVTIPYFTTGIALGSPSPFGPPIRMSSVMRSYIKHSCYSNVDFVISGGKCHWYSVKPIRAGEKLFASFAAQEMNSTKERLEVLMDELKISCDCSRCQGEIACSIERHQLIAERAFRFIDANVKSLHSLQFNANQIKPLMNACVVILRNFGQMNWCDEIAFVSNLFTSIYKIRSVGGGSELNHPLVQEFLSHFDAPEENKT